MIGTDLDIIRFEIILFIRFLRNYRKMMVTGRIGTSLSVGTKIFNVIMYVLICYRKALHLN